VSVKVVWKFPLEAERRQTIQMPTGAKVLKVDMQRGVPTMWALCERTWENEDREFLLVGTGVELPVEAGEHVGSFLARDGEFVWHVFEVA
jgi:hypothetical protein